MLYLRIFLFLGLVFHKLVWEVMKRRDATPSEKIKPKPSFLKSIVKYLKIEINNRGNRKSWDSHPIFVCFSLKNRGLLFCAHNRKIFCCRKGLKIVILKNLGHTKD